MPNIPQPLDPLGIPRKIGPLSHTHRIYCLQQLPSILALNRSLLLVPLIPRLEQPLAHIVRWLAPGPLLKEHQRAVVKWVIQDPAEGAACLAATSPHVAPDTETIRLLSASALLVPVEAPWWCRIEGRSDVVHAAVSVVPVTGFVLVVNVLRRLVRPVKAADAALPICGPNALQYKE